MLGSHSAPDGDKIELPTNGTISLKLEGKSIGKINKKARAYIAREVFKDFCLTTTVHGIHYIIEPKRHFLERLWWIIACILAMALCTFAILSIWTTWREYPVTMTFDDKTTSIDKIPFPAVTICTTQKLKEGIFESDKSLEELFGNDTNKMDAFGQICGYRIQEQLRFSPNASIYEAIFQINPNQSTIFLEVQMSGLHRQLHFHPIITEQGLCFTYNSLNSAEIYADGIASELLTVKSNPSAADWNVENGYRSNVNGSDIYPHRVFGTGFHNMLHMFVGLFVDGSIEFCQFYANGFMVSFHPPNEFAKPSADYTFVHFDKYVRFSIKPRMTATSSDLRRYAPHVRGCYFQSERRLRFFRSYNRAYCELECLTNFTWNQCGCVKFHMPRDENTTICRSLEIDCTSKALIDFTNNLHVKECNCLPDCASLSYDVEADHIQIYDPRSDDTKLQRTNKSGFKAASLIEISFKEQTFISINRLERSTIWDFISSCGGLLGLFMGISVLSVFELIYFFTLRLCCQWREQRRIQPVERTWANRRRFSNVRGQRSNLRRRF